MEEKLFTYLPEWLVSVFAALLIVLVAWKKYLRDDILALVGKKKSGNELDELKETVKRQDEAIGQAKEALQRSKLENTANATVAAILISYIRDKSPDSEVLKTAENILKGEQ